MYKGKPILVTWNNGKVKEYKNQLTASKQLNMSTTLITSFILNKRPREIVKIEFKEA